MMSVLGCYWAPGHMRPGDLDYMRQLRPPAVRVARTAALAQMSGIVYNTGVRQPQKSCRRDASNIRRREQVYKGDYAMSDSISQPSALKVCNKCKQAKPLSEFTQRKSGKRAGTYEGHCKECMRLASAEYRAQHPERARESCARSAEKNREQRNADYRVRLAADAAYRKKRNDKSRRWRDQNRQRIADYNAKRFDDQPEAMRSAIKSSQRKYPERHSARKAVNYAIQVGKLPPASTLVCAGCQEAQAAHYHHHSGYSEEHKLDVIALCTQCHGKAHWLD